MFPGGKGGNQAVAAARLGGQVSLVAKLGNDIFGKNAIAGYEKEGIQTEFIFVDEIKECLLSAGAGSWAQLHSAHFV